MSGTANAQLNQITTDLATSAVVKIFAGGQPADANTATTAANVVVASLAMATTAFTTAAANIMTANAIASDTSAAGGTAAWFTLAKATGLRVVDGSVGTSGADLNLNTTTIATGATVQISSFTISVP